MTVVESRPIGPTPKPPSVWPWFVIEGAILVVLGVTAAVLPRFAGVAASVVFGSMLVLSGLVGLAASIAWRGLAHPLWTFTSALVALVAGALVLWAPLAGVFSLAVLIAAYLIVDAAASFGIAFGQRRRGSGGWPWLVISGVINLVLAGAILFLGPVGDAILVGFVVAIDLIVGGISLIGLGVVARA